MIPELRGSNYKDQLKRLNMTNHAYRGIHGEMIQTYQYMHGYYDEDPFLTSEKYRKTKGCTLKLQEIRSKKIMKQRFFSILNSWTSLPKDIAEATSLNILKNNFVYVL